MVDFIVMFFTGFFQRLPLWCSIRASKKRSRLLKLQLIRGRRESVSIIEHTIIRVVCLCLIALCQNTSLGFLQRRSVSTVLVSFPGYVPGMIRSGYPCRTDCSQAYPEWIADMVQQAEVRNHSNGFKKPAECASNAHHHPVAVSFAANAEKETATINPTATGFCMLRKLRTVTPNRLEATMVAEQLQLPFLMLECCLAFKALYIFLYVYP